MRICCVLRLASITGLINAPTQLIHGLVYLAQKLYGLRLRYRFAWLASGPYSRELAAELRRGCIEGTCGIGEVDDVGLKLKELINRVSRATGLGYARVIDLLSSYVMLLTDVYPKPSSVAAELTRRKPWVKGEYVLIISREVMRLIKVPTSTP